MTQVIRLQTETKQVAEEFYLPFDFSLRCAALTETITEIISIVAVNQGLVVASSNVTIDSLAYSGQVCACLVKGGTDLEKYLITAKVRTSLGQLLEAECYVYVRNKP